MNKGEFVKAIAAKADLEIKTSAKFVDALIEVVTDELKKGEKIQLAGFGSFEVKNKPAREAINPLTKKKIKVAASKSPSFKFGKAFKDLLN